MYKASKTKIHKSLLVNYLFYSIGFGRSVRTNVKGLWFQDYTKNRNHFSILFINVWNINKMVEFFL